MRRIHVLALITLAALPLGCKSGGGTGVTHDLGPLTYRITGIVTEPNAPPKNYAFADFVRTKSNAVDFVRLPNATHVIQTAQAVKMEIKQQVDTDNHDFSVLLGGGSLGAPAQGNLKLTPDGPSFEVGDGVGWVLAWGFWPFAQTRWVSAAAHGSTFIIQKPTDTDATIYFVGPTPGRPPILTVTCLDGTSLTLGTGEFAKVPEGASCTSVSKSAFGAGETALVAEWLKIAGAAGWTAP